jgi:hypothetical protein
MLALRLRPHPPCAVDRKRRPAPPQFPTRQPVGTRANAVFSSVSDVSDLCFKCFHLNVAKVDLGFCICCKGNIRMLQAYVSGVSDVCFKCFIWMFQK